MKVMLVAWSVGQVERQFKVVVAHVLRAESQVSASFFCSSMIIEIETNLHKSTGKIVCAGRQEKKGGKKGQHTPQISRILEIHSRRTAGSSTRSCISRASSRESHWT